LDKALNSIELGKLILSKEKIEARLNAVEPVLTDPQKESIKAILAKIDEEIAKKQPTESSNPTAPDNAIETSANQQDGEASANSTTQPNNSPEKPNETLEDRIKSAIENCEK